MPENSPPPNLIRFQQIRKVRSYATGQKIYRADLINSRTLHMRSLHRWFRSVTKAESYACAVAARLNRWLSAK